MGACGLLVVLHFEKRRAEIAPGHRHRRVDGHGAARFLDSLLWPSGLAIHFGEVGAEQAVSRRELGSALHLFNGFAELARLMGNDAKQMHRFRQIRLRFEHTAAKRFGFRQPALGAAAICEEKSIADRHHIRHRYVPISDLKEVDARPSSHCMSIPESAASWESPTAARADDDQRNKK